MNMMKIMQEEAEQRRKEEEERFQLLLKAFQATQTVRSSTPVLEPTVTTTATPLFANTDSGMACVMDSPVRSYAEAKPPPPLTPDVALRAFNEWKQKWMDYATIVDLDKLPQAKQFALLRSCLSDEIRIMGHALNVPHESILPIGEILDRIMIHIKGQKNEALSLVGIYIKVKNLTIFMFA